MKKILKIILIIIVFLIVVILGVSFLIKYKLRNNIFETNNYVFIIEKSSDMEPEIRKDELVIVKKNMKYDLDEIILYKNFNNKFMIRRIVQIDEYGFIAKADNKKNVEPSEEIRSIKGKVINHSKMLGIVFK